MVLCVCVYARARVGVHAHMRVCCGGERERMIWQLILETYNVVQEFQILQ